MTQVIAEDGSTIVTDLPADKVADLQPKAEPVPEPAKEPEAPQAPAAPAKAEEPKEPAKPGETPKEPEGQPAPADRKPKASPFQTLLEKKHEAEEAAKAATERANAAEAKLQELAAGKGAPADVKQLVEQLATLETDEARIAAIVEFARQGVKPELPKEVQDLIASEQARKQVDAAEQAYTAEFTRLEATLKDDVLKKPEVQEALRKLALSTGKAPDGEPYFKKPLFELYMQYVRPEHEPAKPTIEENRGGNKGGTEVLDFEAIHNDDAALDKFAKDSTPEQWSAYTKWRDAKSGDVPIRRAH